MKRTRIAYLLFLHYIQALSADEEKELQAWRADDRRHEDLMREVTDPQAMRKRQETAALFDEEQAWGRIRKQTVQAHSSGRVWQRWLGVGVAAAFVGVGLVLAFYLSPSVDDSRLLSHSPMLLPPQDGVILSYNEERRVLKESSCALTDTLTLADAGSVPVDTFSVEVPRGNTFMMILDDGTKLYLNSETQVRVPRRFRGRQREINLLYGEAYLEVVHDSVHSFVVHARQQRVRVLGTSFGIRAYKNEKQTLTTLVSGRVQVRSGGREDCLSPGFQAVCTAGSLTVRKVNASLYTSWHQGLFVFRNEPLGAIMETLARGYDVEVAYTNEDLKHICFTGELKRYHSVNEFLEKLELLEKVRFSVEGRTITVSPYY